MKKYLLLLLILSSCGKKNNPHPAKTTGFYTFKCVSNQTLSTGEVVETPQPVQFYYIWKADNRDFELKWPDDYSGYAFDKVSQTSIKYDAVSQNPISTTGELSPGRYFFYVVTDLSASPKGMYSYTYFDIVAGQVTDLKKVFRDGTSLSYESW